MSDVMNCQEKLILEAENKGYLTFDDIMDMADTFMLSVSEVDKLSEGIQLRGIMVYEEAPTPNNSEAELDDYSRVDYDAIFDEIIGIDSDLEFIVEQIRNLPPPQYGEVQVLVVQAANENAYAKERIILMHLRLVLKIALSTAKQYRLELSDAVSSGFIGLQTAVEKFDPDGFSTFQSYASAWIYQNILRECSPIWMSYYFPVHYRDKMYAVLDRCKNYDLNFSTNIQATDYIEYAADDIGISQTEAEEYLYAVLQQKYGKLELNKRLSSYNDEHCCLDKYFNEINLSEYTDDDVELLDLVAGELSEGDPLQCAFLSDLKQQQHRVLESLSTKEKDVICMRFGLLDDYEYTLEEIGEAFNLTRERIRQIQLKALRKLRHPLSARKIRDYYND